MENWLLMNECNPLVTVAFPSMDQVELERPLCIHEDSCPTVDDMEYIMTMKNEETKDKWIFHIEGSCIPITFIIPRNANTKYDAFTAKLFKCEQLPDGSGLKVVSSTSVARTPPSNSVTHGIESRLARMTLASSSKCHVTVSVARSTYWKASVKWTASPYHSSYCAEPDRWLITLKRCDGNSVLATCYFYVDAQQSELDIPLALTAGAKYRVNVKAMKSKSSIFDSVLGENTKEFVAELSMNDLTSLFDQAVQVAGPSPSSAPCQWFYRNTKKQYFNESLNELEGKMEVRLKDNCGDPASPINNNLRGLFFSASPTDKFGNPPPKSPFGSSRLLVPAEVLLDEAPNLYFADFYCLGSSIHYLTLVMTKSDSSADDFCLERLPPVDIDDNPFLYRDDCDELRVYCGWKVCVELFYTEDIDIKYIIDYRGAELQHGITLILKASNMNYKSPSCDDCNVPSADDELPEF